MPRRYRQRITHNGRAYIPINSFFDKIGISRRTGWRRIADGIISQPIEHLNGRYLPEDEADAINDAAFSQTKK